MLSVFDLGEGGKHIASMELPTVMYSQAWHESSDGSVYLSVHTGHTLRIYKPLETESPYFSVEVSPAGLSENFWLHGKDGHDYNYVMSSQANRTTIGGGNLVKVSVIDVTSKQEIFSRESEDFGRGSPFLSGAYGDPRLVIASKVKDKEVYVLDPLNPGFATQTVPISHSIISRSPGPTGIAKFTDSAGNENLVINGSGKAVLVRLFSRPSL
jgi:hypothetical protein